VEDERIINVAISIMEITGITLVRMLTVMTLVLDSLLEKNLGNMKITLGVMVSGLILGKQNVSSTISLGIQHNNAPNYPLIICKPMLIWCVILNLRVLILLGFLIQMLISI
jgi:hypothetical protein